jgi:importin subunit beta-1
MRIVSSDPSIVVKDSAAWALGKVVDLFADIAMNESVLPHFLQAMSVGLESEPRVAGNCCVVRLLDLGQK